MRRWIEEYNIKSGFCDTIFQKLKGKIAQIPKEERVCALKWDKMSIKSYKEYSSKLDEIKGLVDLRPLDRQTPSAFLSFVLNVRHPWWQPLAYFLPGKCMRLHEIIHLLQIYLDKLNETGANMKLVTCDQGSKIQINRL